MSSAGRGAERQPDDAYYTPAWATHAILRRLDLPLRGVWVDPCAGSGAIIRAARERSPHNTLVDWHVAELREECRADLEALDLEPTIGDALDPDHVVNPWTGGYGSPVVCLTNPPYKFALEFVKRSLIECEHTVMLLRLAFLESQKRATWLRSNKPDVYVLPKRPSFVHGRTDSAAYAWMHWRRSARPPFAIYDILDLEGLDLEGLDFGGAPESEAA